MQGAHSTYKKLAVQWLNEVLCPALRDSVVADSFRLRNRQLLKPAKRCGYTNSRASNPPFFKTSLIPSSL